MQASTQTESLNLPREPGSSDAPTQPTLIAAHGQQCAACNAPLAADQLYCLQCGERRGPSRLASLDALTGSGAPPAAAAVAAAPRAPRLSASSTLIAGVGVLLLAMGIGVLIGRSGNTTTTRPASAVQVVTVPGAGAAAATAGAAATPAATATKAARSTKAGNSTASPAVSGATVVKPKKNAPPPTKVVHVGSPGSGPGYQHGHFTGNFFGGG